MKQGNGRQKKHRVAHRLFKLRGTRKQGRERKSRYPEYRQTSKVSALRETEKVRTGLYKIALLETPEARTEALERAKQLVREHAFTNEACETIVETITNMQGGSI